MRRAAVGLAALACASSCAVWRGFNDAINQRDRLTQRVESTADGWYGVWGNAGRKAEHGPLHPAVVEFVFAQPGGPFARSIDYALALEASPPDRKKLAEDERTMVKASVALVRRLRKDVGKDADSLALTRAFGRYLARWVRKGVAMHGNQGGTVRITWGVVPYRVATKTGYRVHPWRLFCDLSRFERARIVLLRCEWDDHDSVWAWDLRFVPEAFDAKAELSFEQVAASAVPLHDAPEGRRL